MGTHSCIVLLLYEKSDSRLPFPLLLLAPPSPCSSPEALRLLHQEQYILQMSFPDSSSPAATSRAAPSTVLGAPEAPTSIFLQTRVPNFK